MEQLVWDIGDVYQPTAAPGAIPEPEETRQTGPAETKAPTAEDANQVKPKDVPPVSSTEQVPTVTVPSAKRYQLPKVVFEDDKKPEQPQNIAWDVGDVYDPNAPKPAKKEPDSWLDPHDYPLLRGGMEGLRSIEGGKDFVTVLDMSLGNMSDADKLKTILAQDPQAGPDPWARRQPSISGVRSLGDLKDWLLESAGSGVVSTLPSVVGGVAGGIGGTALAGPVGGLVGTAGGAALPSVMLGISGMYQDLRSNDGVRKALQDGTISVDQFQRLTYIGGLMSGALDAIPAAHWGGKAIGLEAVKKEVRDTIIKAAIKGGLEEGSTEGLQQIISEATQDIGGGSSSIGQQALNVLDASLQGLVGGVVFGGTMREKQREGVNTGEEDTPKPDDQPGQAAPTQPEGTPAGGTGQPGGQPTPGGLGATPPQPEGEEKQPEETAPTVVVGGNDTRTAPKPSTSQPQPGTPAAAPSGGVTVLPSGTPAPDLTAAATGGTTTVGGGGEFDIAAETAPGADVSEAERLQNESLRELLAQNQQQIAQDAETSRRSQATATIPQVVTGTDPTLAATLKQAGVGSGTETLGTGQALIPGMNPNAIGANPVEPAATAANQNVAPPVQAAEFGQNAAAETPVNLPAGAETAVGAAPQTLTEGPSALDQEVEPGPELTAAAAPAAETLPAAPATVETTPAAVTTPVTEPTAEPTSELPPKAAEAVKVSRRKKKTVVIPKKEAPTEAAAPQAPSAAPTVKTAPAKAAEAAAVSKAKQQPPAKAEVVTKGELLKQEQARKAAIEQEQAARKAAEAARPQLNKDIHRQAKDELRGDLPDVSEGDLERHVRAVTDEVAAEADRTKSPRERIEAAVPKVIERVKARVAEEEKARLAEHLSEEELKKQRQEQQGIARKAAEEEKRKAQAAETQGTKKERAGAEKGKSAEGILGQAEKTTKRQYDKERLKPAAQQNPQLMEWGRLYEERKGTKDAERAEYDRRMQEALEAHAKASDVAREKAEEERLGKRKRDVEATVKPALETVPKTAVAETASETGQIQSIKLNMLRSVQAVETAMKKSGQELGQRIDTARQSPAENFAIYTRMLVNNLRGAAEKAGVPIEQDQSAHGVVEYEMARALYDSGNYAELNDLIRAERLWGTGGAEQVGEVASDVNTAEALAEGETRDVNLKRTAEEGEASIEPFAREAQRRETWTAADDARFQELIEKKNLSDEGLTKAEKAELNALHDKYDKRNEVAEPISPEDVWQKVDAGHPVTQPHEAQQTVINPYDNSLVHLKNKSRRGSEVLTEVGKLADTLADPSAKRGGLISILRNHLLKQLVRMVGDVQVTEVSHDEMLRLQSSTRQRYTGQGNPAVGLYYDLGEEIPVRNRGMRPTVYVLEGLPDHEHVHTVIHEMTHAATVQALRLNLHDSKFIFNRLYEEAKKAAYARYSQAQLRSYRMDYAFTHPVEFVAEMFSNHNLQAYMSHERLPLKLALQLNLATKGQQATWWDAAVAAVSNAVGMLSGLRGQTYMDAVVRAFPTIARTSEEQFNTALKEVYGPGATQQNTGIDFQLPRAMPNGPLDFQQFRAEALQRSGALTDKFQNWKGDLFSKRDRRIRDMLRSTGDMDRAAQQLTGDRNNGLSQMMRVLLKKGPLKEKIAALGLRVHRDLSVLKFKQRSVYNQLSKILHESTRYGFDPRYALNHPANGHIEKTGDRHLDKRNELAAQHAAWNALPDDAKRIGSALIDHYANMHSLVAAAKTRHAVDAALRKWRKTGALPPGENLDTITQWVHSGEAAREVAQQTQRDKDLHAALGNTATTLAEMPDLQKLKGIYVPLMRRGSRFIHGQVKVATPAGAVIDRASVDPASGFANRFLFTDQQRLRDFVNNSDLQVRTHTMHIDPKTGKKISAHDVHLNPVKVHVATVNNKFLEMSDSRSFLNKRREELHRQGHHVSAIRATENLLKSGGRDILAPDAQRLINSLDQSKTGGPGSVNSEMVKNAILDAQIRALTNPSHLQRYLKRKGTMGYDADLAAGLRDYTNHAASHIANLTLAPEMADAAEKHRKYIESESRNYGTGTGRRIETLDQLANELGKRLNNPYFRDRETTGGRIVDALMDVSYMRHLFSPHYTIMQTLQPMMITYPMLSSQFGHAVAWRMMVSAYRMGGVRKTLGRGFQESWAHGKTLLPGSTAHLTSEQLAGIGTHDQIWHDLAAGEADAQQLQDVFREVRELGFGASSGQEMGDIAEDDTGGVFTPFKKAEKVIGRVSNIAKQLPEAAEGINRYVTATAAYRAMRGKVNADPNLSEAERHDIALRYAVSLVEQTQGGYAKANNPNIFSIPLLRFPMQFKKYGVMFGQLYYGNIARAVGKDPVMRKLARKQLARLSLMTMVFAGLGGQGMVEIARNLFNVANMLGLSDDDWDEEESAIQGLFARIGRSMGLGKDFSNSVAEIGMHGLTRSLGVDTSTSLGNDSTYTFGSPKHPEDEESMFAWLGKTAFGAPGTMLADALYKRELPWPKIVDNIVKGYEQMTTGLTIPKTGEKVSKPLGVEAAWKMLGFGTAAQAEQFERGGGGAAAKQLKKIRDDRRALMAQWRNAPNRDAVFSGPIREWNRTHKGSDRIQYQDLLASQKQHARIVKEREKQQQLEEAD